MHIDEYVDCLFDNLGYMGKEMFMMCCIVRHELIFGIDVDAVRVYKKIIPQTLNLKGFKMQVLSFKVIIFKVKSSRLGL